MRGDLLPCLSPLIRGVQRDFGNFARVGVIGKCLLISCVYYNFWERVRLSITYDRADEDILKETFRTVFISMYERFEVWLNEKSKQYPRYKEDLEKLYNRWKFTSSQ